MKMNRHKGVIPLSHTIHTGKNKKQVLNSDDEICLSHKTNRGEGLCNLMNVRSRKIKCSLHIP